MVAGLYLVWETPPDCKNIWPEKLGQLCLLCMVCVVVAGRAKLLVKKSFGLLNPGNALSDLSPIFNLKRKKLISFYIIVFSLKVKWVLKQEIFKQYGLCIAAQYLSPLLHRKKEKRKKLKSRRTSSLEDNIVDFVFNFCLKPFKELGFSSMEFI